MKKILFIFYAAAIPLSAAASCNLTGGACSPSDLHNPTLNEMKNPDNLIQMQRPDHFQNPYQTPYNGINLNMSAPAQEGAVEPGDYNSNCQFGFCNQAPRGIMPR